ncbi:hypothetical protein FOCC_FOCC013484 [Frankliniella occidentalis]|nr:hypothetical protein FOCC_FOCC013484 [Frankliniella occidentalis]
MFVKGVALLNSSSISPEDITSAGSLLEQFVKDFENIYGVDNVSHNVHMCLHLHQSVQLLGPLWAVSCFQFEDMNGRLKNLVHGTRHVGLQIHSRLALITHLPLMVRKLGEGPAKQFCENLKKKYRLKVVDVISPGVYCVGNFTSVTDDTAWVFGILRREGVVSGTSKTIVFNKLLKDRLLFVSDNYKRGGKVSCYCKYRQESILSMGM